MSLSQTDIGNRLLKRVQTSDFELLQPHLEPVEMTLRQMLALPDTEISHIYFPNSGVLSVLAQSPEERIEVGMVGREGAAGIAAAFGADRHAHAMMCQAKGQALRIDRAALADAVTQSSSLAAIIGRYMHYLTIQVGQTAYANASLNIEARLARWILMTDDRSDDFELNMTHEFLAIMLGVRRPGVTTAVHVLEGAKMIRAERGTIVVLDRGKLEDLASDAYGLPEAAYERLVG